MIMRRFFFWCSIVSLMLLFGLALEACKKDVIFPEPDLLLIYTLDTVVYSEKSEYRFNKSENYQLTPANTVTQVQGIDSVLMRYASALIDKDGRPTIQVIFSKRFHRNQLDSLAGGKFIPKNNEDFYSTFKTGNAQIVSYDSTYLIKEGIDFTYQSTTDYYTFHSSGSFIPPVSAQDTSNLFDVEKVNSDVDFGELVRLGVIPYNTFRGVMVTVNFKCRLYATNPPNSPLVLTNGTFQSVFIDR